MHKFGKNTADTHCSSAFSSFLGVNGLEQIGFLLCSLGWESSPLWPLQTGLDQLIWKPIWPSTQRNSLQLCLSQLLWYKFCPHLPWFFVLFLSLLKAWVRREAVNHQALSRCHQVPPFPVYSVSWNLFLWPGLSLESGSIFQPISIPSSLWTLNMINNNHLTLFLLDELSPTGTKRGSRAPYTSPPPSTHRYTSEFGASQRVYGTYTSFMTYWL